MADDGDVSMDHEVKRGKRENDDDEEEKEKKKEYKEIEQTQHVIRMDVPFPRLGAYETSKATNLAADAVTTVAREVRPVAIRYSGNTGPQGRFLSQLLLAPGIYRLYLADVYPLMADHIEQIVYLPQLQWLDMPFMSGNNGSVGDDQLMQLNQKLQLLEKKSLRHLTMHSCGALLTIEWMRLLHKATIANPLLEITCTDLADGVLCIVDEFIKERALQPECYSVTKRPDANVFVIGCQAVQTSDGDGDDNDNNSSNNSNNNNNNNSTNKTSDADVVIN